MKTYLSTQAGRFARYVSTQTARVVGAVTTAYVGLGSVIASAQTDPHVVEELMTEADIPGFKAAILNAMVELAPIAMLFAGWVIYRKFVRSAH